MEKLREELAKLLFDWIDDDGWEWWEVDKDVRDHYRNKTDSILSLPSLREALEKATGTCEWIPDRYNDGVWWTGCGKLAVYADGYSTEENPYCPKCGRNVEVPDGN